MKSVFLVLFITLSSYALTIGEIPKRVSIGGDNGGFVTDGTTWHSPSLIGKVMVMFYVDPDEKDTNSHFSKKLKEQKFDKKKFGSIAVINLAATWKPDFIIEMLLEAKQKEYPNTLYVKDKNSVLVNEWGLEDDSSEILLFSKDSKLLFYKSGKMQDSDISKAISIIKSNL